MAHRSLVLRRASDVKKSRENIFAIVQAFSRHFRIAPKMSTEGCASDVFSSV